MPALMQLTDWVGFGMTDSIKPFDPATQCFFCGADNRYCCAGYGGERFCNTCDKGGRGEPDEPFMAYKGNLPQQLKAKMNPLIKFTFAMAEPVLMGNQMKGYQLVLGFDTLEEVQEAHQAILALAKDWQSQERPETGHPC